MTKKSDARLKRDEMSANLKAEQVVSPYVQLEEMYRSQMNLFGPYYQMAKLISTPDISVHLTDIRATTNLVRGLSADAKDLYEQTQAEYAKHGGRTTMPDAINPEENFDLIMHFQQYQMFYGMHTQNIVPIMMQLDEHLREALRRKSEVEAAAISTASAGIQAEQATAAAIVSAAPTMAGYEAAAVPN